MAVQVNQTNDSISDSLNGPLYVDPAYLTLLEAAGVPYLAPDDKTRELATLPKKTYISNSVVNCVWETLVNKVREEFDPRGLGRERAAKSLIVLMTSCDDVDIPNHPATYEVAEEERLYIVQTDNYLEKIPYKNGASVFPQSKERSFDALIDELYSDKCVEGAVLIDDDDNGRVVATHTKVNRPSYFRDTDGFTGADAARHAANCRPFTISIKISANTGKVSMYQKLADENGGTVALIKQYDPVKQEIIEHREPRTS